MKEDLIRLAQLVLDLAINGDDQGARADIADSVSDLILRLEHEVNEESR